MKKTLTFYSIIWAISLAVFNAVVFLVPRELCGIDRWAQSGFWVGYALSTVAFIGQLITCILCLRHTNPDRIFLRLSLPLTAHTALIVSLVAGAVFMLIPTIPAWIGSIVSLVLLLYFVVAVLKAQIAVQLIAGVDERIKQTTAFLRAATDEAYNVMQSAEGEALRASAKKVWEALRYSDPVSHERMAGVEYSIDAALKQFRETVLSGNAESATEEAEQLLRLISERNQACKTLKSVR